MQLKYFNCKTFTCESGHQVKNLSLTFQLIGCEIGTAPIILINHALTGNSDVASESKGWWKSAVGKEKVIDLNRFTVLTINIPGNGYDGTLIEEYTKWTCKDIARLFLQVCDHLQIEQLHAIVGSSLGGGIAWEMVTIRPSITVYLVPVASDWKSTDWVMGIAGVQNDILNNSTYGIEDARKMAMFFYRTPSSLNERFNRTKTEDNTEYNINSWLNHHGNKLASRFQKSAYLMMNHLMSTIEVGKNNANFLEKIKGWSTIVVQIGIDSDILFTAQEIKETKRLLDQAGVKNCYHEIKSIHGHDAFLIEYDQLENILKTIFN